MTDTKSPKNPTPRAALLGLALFVCAVLLLVGALTRGWLHAELTERDREVLGRDVATVDLGLIGVELCRPNGECVSDWYNADQFREDRGLRVGSRVAFAGALLSVFLCVVGGALLVTGRGARMPRTATALALGAAGLCAAYVHGAGTSKENPLTAEYGWTFHAGFSFYVTMVAIVGAIVVVLLVPGSLAPASPPASRT